MTTVSQQTITPGPSPMQHTHSHRGGGRVVGVDGRALPVRGTHIETRAAAGQARVVLEQRFFNAHDEPLRVSYQVPLPAHAAVAGYAFTMGDRRIVGEIDRRRAARERFEEALLAGHTAALFEEDRSSLFEQEIGNIPPHTELVVELSIDQPLKWLADGQWEWRFPTVVAPRYQGAPGRVADAAKTEVVVAEGPLDVTGALSLVIGDTLVGGEASSPSHDLAQETGGRIAFRGEQGAALDRDIVVRWPVAGAETGVALESARPPRDHARGDAAYGLLTLVPPAAGSRLEPVARDLVVLLDTSGSMGGEPLDQAKRVVNALIDQLAERDRLELIEFSWRPNRWKRKAVAANPANKTAAQAWLESLRAAGGTEMYAGIVEALAPLRADSQRQVLLVTDGLIGFEAEIVGRIIEKLPPS